MSRGQTVNIPFVSLDTEDSGAGLRHRKNPRQHRLLSNAGRALRNSTACAKMQESPKVVLELLAEILQSWDTRTCLQSASSGLELLIMARNGRESCSATSFIVGVPFWQTQGPTAR